jgi:hypothetical protein
VPAIPPPTPAERPDPGRRRLLRAAAGPLCCGVAAGLGLLAAPDAWPSPVPSDAWPDDVRRLWTAAWDGLDPARVVDVHAHLIGHTAEAPGDQGAFVHPRTRSPWAFGDWLRRQAIERASDVHRHRSRLSERYVERMATLWSAFPSGAVPCLLAFDAAVKPDGTVDVDRTMFATGDGYARRVATAQRWGWAASIHPDRRDAIARLHAARAGGARLVKWLPSAMAIDPAAPRHRAYYRALVDLDLTLLSHAGEEVAVTGAAAYDWINPLLLRAPLEAGARVIVAHCASLGTASDLDAPGRPAVPAFDLFRRLMDDRGFGDRVLGDLSAVTQINRRPAVLRTLLERTDWHDRLLWGSDYPLPAIGWLTDTGRLAREGLVDADEAAVLERLQALNPVAFDFALKRRLRVGSTPFGTRVFESRDRVAP